MPPPKTSAHQVLDKLKSASGTEYFRKIGALSYEERKVLYEYAMGDRRTSGIINARGLSIAGTALGLSQQQSEMMAVGYDEHIKHIYPSETETDAFHEALIRKRWAKMSKKSKEELLLAAWPNMSRRHRPDLERMLSGRDANRTQGCTVEESKEYLWPYINLEDLLRPTALLMLLNSRGRHDPDEFAYSDLELAPMFKSRKEFLALHKESVTMEFLGCKTAETYWQFVAWDDSVAASKSMKEGRTLHVQHGVQILEIQRGIWEFLVQCVVRILEDIISPGLPPDSIPMPEPPPIKSTIKPLNSLNIVARDAPYKLPSRLDLPRLKSLVSAQKSQAIDHAIALREDPSYFVEMTERYRSHRVEFIPDVYGCSHPYSKDFPSYCKAQRQMASDAHFSVFFWHEIQDRITKLQYLASKYAPNLDPKKSLPFDYLEAMAETRHFLECAEAPASPPLRKAHVRDDTGNDNLSMCRILPSLTVDPADKILGHILELLRIFEDKGLLELFSLHVILDEFERLMQDEPRAKTLISPHIASSLSQLSVLSECLYHLHQFQPWARKVESMVEENAAPYLAQYDTLIRHWGTINHLYDKFFNRKMFKVGKPTDGKFHYPAEVRRTRETVDAMRSAEAALDAFWKAANAHWLVHAGASPTLLVQHIIGDRVLHRTPPWVNPKATPRCGTPNGNIADTSILFFGFDHDVSKQITGNFSKLSVSTKEKKKTRGLLANEGAVVKDSVVATNIPSSGRSVAIDKRALKVFKSLFHSPHSPDQPGEISWPDFLHAMVKAGFGAEKLQGSAWHFTPQNLELDCSIQFHEPHPGNKLPFTWARRYGRRLTRAFGWSLESFKLA
ncbi:hypothetical protein BKA63DRAFT_586258 [Paraphoma chrysanthemicola]|nr:hypothetical protein BKA63DRAFT_586258 [Paraphoma chrysanthemicola]